MTTTKRKFYAAVDKKQAILLLLAAAVFYIVLPQLGSFHNSLSAVKQASPVYGGLALTAGLLTYFSAGATYFFLAVYPLGYGRTVLVQLGGMFANRLLPAGIGGIGVNYRYLRRNRHNAAQAAGVVAVNNITGFTGHIFLLLCVVLISHANLADLHFAHPHTSLLLLLLLTVAVSLAGALVYFRTTVVKGIGSFIAQLVLYQRRPKQLGLALMSSASLTLCNVGCLWFCAQALHASLTFLAALFVFTLGLAVGTALPTPGGLGGVEAGLVAGLISQGVASPTALAIVLAYRLINYWLVLAMGAAAFVVCQKRGYV